MPIVPRSDVEIVGPSSPEQRALRVMERVVADAPDAALPGDGPRAMAHLVATHLLHLLHGAGLLNLHGHHSAAVCLFRQMVDALDCLVAVSRVPGAAGSFARGELRASQAAKLADEQLGEIVTLGYSGARITWGEYRKQMRNDFNRVAHCSSELTEYNIALVPVGVDMAEAKLIGPGQASDLNAHQIDMWLVVQLLETLNVMRRCFDPFFHSHPRYEGEIHAVTDELTELVKQHAPHRCYDMYEPAESKRVRE